MEAKERETGGCGQHKHGKRTLVVASSCCVRTRASPSAIALALTSCASKIRNGNDENTPSREQSD
jgi:hypothetical protein